MQAATDMNTETIITFHEDGTMSMVGDPPNGLENMGKVISKRRLSHIWPVHPVKRLAFRLIRRVFGDRGVVPEWTRSWSGPWEVRVIDQPKVRHIALYRWQCVRWEQAWFNGE